MVSLVVLGRLVLWDPSDYLVLKVDVESKELAEKLESLECKDVLESPVNQDSQVIVDHQVLLAHLVLRAVSVTLADRVIKANKDLLVHLDRMERRASLEVPDHKEQQDLQVPKDLTEIGDYLAYQVLQVNQD